ncbi:serine/threonine protein kinase [Kovacikia minuta CCNUW1]|uniref:serine/threonine-protein kinase n=1 Tax=Kovacikia minuta TaxID=2931930 RepID=UPI001CCA4EA6|nr:serine/threonine-protein kinase [Kovacikia minuta]UBF26571.1 serine/threonine protein kinase [Kovacikia minuta CCNUW1]
MSNLLVKELKRSKYRLLGLVGQGQFGRVYCASHRRTGRLFALKELDKERFPTHKFLRELRFLLSLQHPNIVTCYALEHTRTGRYLVMDYCEGGTLRSLIDEDIRLHPAQSLKLIADILAGLAHAHDRGIIHCDIKPENILLSLHPEGWTARISDFGIARLSQEITKDGTGNTGSPAYMAPERFYGQHSYSSDLYAVGILLFELLVGYRPFSGPPAELMAAHLNQPVKLPNAIPVVLQTIILTALQKLPARRFRSALEMLTAIESVLQMELNFGADWANSQLIQPTSNVTVYPFKVVHETILQAEVRQLVGMTEQNNIPRSRDSASSWIDVQGNRSHLSSNPKGDLVYQVFKSRIGCQSYPEGILNRKSEFGQVGEASLTTVRLPETIQELVVRPQGCFAIAQRAVYLISNDLFSPGVAQHGQKRLQHGIDSGAVPQHNVPRLIATLGGEFFAAIAPGGQWMATAVLEPGCLTRCLRIWHGSDGQPISVSHPLAHVFQLLALDSRHFATFSHTVDLQSNACITGALVEVFTRRGKSVGTLNLPVPLRGAIAASIPHRLVAMEPGHQNSVLLVDLKPLRISRVGLEIAPVLLTAATWGYVLISEAGQILLLDKYGQGIGRMEGPPNPTAIAILDPHVLLVTTWKHGTGNFYTIDLRQLEIVF